MFRIGTGRVNDYLPSFSKTHAHAHAHDIDQFFPSLLTLFFIIHFPPFTSSLGISAKEFEDNLIKTMITYRVTVHTHIYNYLCTLDTINCALQSWQLWRLQIAYSINQSVDRLLNKFFLLCCFTLTWFLCTSVVDANFFSVSDQRPDLAIQDLWNFFAGKSSDPRPVWNMVFC